MKGNEKGARRLGGLSDHNVLLTPVKERQGGVRRKTFEQQCSAKKV